MSRSYKEKISALKALLSGNSEGFAPPATHVVIEKEDGIYEVGGQQMTLEQFYEWKRSVGKKDTLLHIQLRIITDCEPINENYIPAPPILH